MNDMPLAYGSRRAANVRALAKSSRYLRQLASTYASAWRACSAVVLWVAL